MTDQATLHDFADLPTDSPMPLIDRQRIIGSHLMISRVVLHEGFEVAVHAHANEQFVVCLEGETEFTLEEPGGTRTVTVTGGQVLELPPNVPHGARAIRRTVILDCFSPPSEKTGVDA